MSEATHTPGEWRAIPHKYGLWRVLSGSKVIADHVGSHDDLSGDSSNNSSGEANARLMAAAPELLEALEEVQKELAAYRDGEQKSYGSLEELKYCVVDDAIAKVRG